MELADVTDSKSVGSDTVRVQVPPPAPDNKSLKVIMVTFRLFCIRLYFSLIIFSNIRQITVVLIKVKTISYNELVGDSEE